MLPGKPSGAGGGTSAASRGANEAVSALEYAILIGVIAVGIVAAVTPFSGTLQAAITDLFVRIPVITTGVGT